MRSVFEENRQFAGIIILVTGLCGMLVCVSLWGCCKKEKYRSYEEVSTTNPETDTNEKKERKPQNASHRQNAYYDSHILGHDLHGSIYSIRSQHDHSIRSISPYNIDHSVDSTNMRSSAGHF